MYIGMKHRRFSELQVFGGLWGVLYWCNRVELKPNKPIGVPTMRPNIRKNYNNRK